MFRDHLRRTHPSMPRRVRRRAMCVGTIFFLAATLHTSPVGAETAAGTCDKEGYGRRFAFNAVVEFHPTAPKPERYIIDAYSTEFLSSDPNDDVSATSNNYVARLHDNGIVVHTYVSPDDIRYGVGHHALFAGSVLPSVNARGSFVDFEAYFDTRGEPDVSCPAKVTFTGPGGLCLTCPINGG